MNFLSSLQLLQQVTKVNVKLIPVKSLKPIQWENGIGLPYACLTNSDEQVPHSLIYLRNALFHQKGCKIDIKRE
jgi:hypothetical protein